MQAVDRQSRPFANAVLVRTMAIFGTIVAALMIAVAVAYAAVLIYGAVMPRTSSTTGDPLADPAIVQFRAGEHAAAITTSQTDPLAAPGLMQFRAGEHAPVAAPWTGDPLSQPSLVEFRNSEHAAR